MESEAVFLGLDDTLCPYPPRDEAGKAAAWHEAREREYDLDREAFEEPYRTGQRGVRRDVDGVGETLFVGNSLRVGVAGGNAVGPATALVDPGSDVERTGVTGERRSDRRIDESAAVRESVL